MTVETNAEFREKYRVPARTTTATAVCAPSAGTAARANSYAAPALTIRAAALNAACISRGRFELAHRVCTSAAVRLIATTSEKLRVTMPSNTKTKFGDIV